MTSMASNRRSPLLLTGFGISILIAVGVVVRRLYAFINPNSAGPPQLMALDQAFDGHRGLTLAHILPAVVFALLAPIFLLRPDAAWIGPVLLVIGTMVGISAYAMSTFAVGGHLEMAAVFLFNSLFLYWLWRAYLQGRRRMDQDARRSWIRSVAILLGIANTRPLLGFFFATSRLTALQPRQFFGIAFWIGFSINTLAVECWLRRHPAGT